MQHRMHHTVPPTELPHLKAESVLKVSPSLSLSAALNELVISGRLEPAIVQLKSSLLIRNSSVFINGFFATFRYFV